MSFSPAAARAIVAVLMFLCLSGTHLLSPRVHAEELLINGSFEQGVTGWRINAAATHQDCPALSGASALGVSLDGLGARIQQTLPGPIPAGEYRLSGFIRSSGNSSPRAVFSIKRLSNDLTVPLEIRTTSSYTLVELPFQVRAQEQELRIQIDLLTDVQAGVCLDDVSLQMLSEAPAELPTIGQPPTATAVIGTGTPVTGATAATTATTTAAIIPSPSVTPTAMPDPLQFRNGGFEEGITGWRTYGGAADTVGEPRLAGAAAGRFSSSSSSTKWLYQIVAIDPTLAYEFAGHLLPGAGVKEAYLRLSWYSSVDGSGAAIHTDDSTTRVGQGEHFVYLTTGPRTPPEGARSLRVRVMLTPNGAAPAVLYADEFQLHTSSPVAPPPTPQPQAADEPGLNEPLAGETPKTGANRPNTGGVTGRATPASGSTSAERTQTIPAATTAASRLPTPVPLLSTTAPLGQAPPVPWPYLAVPAAAAALSAGYLLGKHQKR